MKLLIAHRGNVNGRFGYYENRPDYVSEALLAGYNAEIDVWYINNVLYLGHDEPQYEIGYEFLLKRGLWIHCKNIYAMELLGGTGINAFIHEKGIVITPSGHLWTEPGCQLTKKSIAVMPETATRWDISNASGICTDYVLIYKNQFE